MGQKSAAETRRLKFRAVRSPRIAPPHILNQKMKSLLDMRELELNDGNDDDDDDDDLYS